MPEDETMDVSEKSRPIGYSYSIGLPHKINETKQMRKRLSKLSRLCDRYGTSDIAGAVIPNAVLEDLGIPTSALFLISVFYLCDHQSTMFQLNPLFQLPALHSV